MTGTGKLGEKFQRGGSKESGMSQRVKVTIRCNRCGERFILRGRKEKGRVETGFKRCLCDNEDDFKIIEEDV